MSFYNVDENKNMNEMGQSGYLRYNRGTFPLVSYGEGISSGDTYLGVNEFCITTEKVYTSSDGVTRSSQVHLENVYTENPSATFIVVPIIGIDVDYVRSLTSFPSGSENFACPVFCSIRLLNVGQNYGVVYSMCNQLIRNDTAYSVITALSYRLLVWRLS